MGGGFGRPLIRRFNGPEVLPTLFLQRKIPVGVLGMLRRSISCALAGIFFAAGIDFLLLTDGQAPGIVIVAAGYVAGLGLIWLGDEIADGSVFLGAPPYARSARQIVAIVTQRAGDAWSRLGAAKRPRLPVPQSFHGA